MSETSKIKKYLMWYKVKELYSKGLNKSQISSLLCIHRQTVSKYLSMDEETFISSQSYERHYWHKLDPYESYVIEELRLWPFLSSPQIHDRLKEHFPSMPDVTSKTVFNFVNRIRTLHNLPKEHEKSYRPYEKQPETPYGRYAQCDFGERWMKNTQGQPLKVYFFAMSLSRSRYKYVYFSRTPFTTSLAVYAHELAFAFFGGIPENIIYDQDKVFLVKENLGDLILTSGFRSLVKEYGFNPVFCRKGDPESKGRIENVVKYVKYNFLRGREFTDLDSLNTAVIAWLSRTANGAEHHGMRRIPSEEFEIEREYLKPYSGIPTLPDKHAVPHHVRKDNVINYRGNYYTVPTGTYKGHNTLVYVEEKDDELHIYSHDTGKTIAVHKISTEKGCLVRNTSHLRDREASLNEYEASVRKELPEEDIIDEYLVQLRKYKLRNYRDNLQVIHSKCKAYSEATLIDAFSKCLNANVYNGYSVMDVAESLRNQRSEPVIETTEKQESVPKTDTSLMTPQTTDISTYNSIFQ